MNIGKLFYIRFYCVLNRFIFGPRWDFGSGGWDITFHLGFFNLQIGDPLNDW